MPSEASAAQAGPPRDKSDRAIRVGILVDWVVAAVLVLLLIAAIAVVESVAVSRRKATLGTGRTSFATLPELLHAYDRAAASGDVSSILAMTSPHENPSDDELVLLGRPGAPTGPYLAVPADPDRARVSPDGSLVAVERYQLRDPGLIGYGDAAPVTARRSDGRWWLSARILDEWDPTLAETPGMADVYDGLWRELRENPYSVAYVAADRLFGATVDGEWQDASRALLEPLYRPGTGPTDTEMSRITSVFAPGGAMRPELGSVEGTGTGVGAKRIATVLTTEDHAPCARIELVREEGGWYVSRIDALAVDPAEVARDAIDRFVAARRVGDVEAQKALIDPTCGVNLNSVGPPDTGSEQDPIDCEVVRFKWNDSAALAIIHEPGNDALPNGHMNVWVSQGGGWHITRLEPN